MKEQDKEFFAQNVHKHIVYQDIDLTLKKYQNRLLNELKLRNLPNDYFKNKTMIDIGTGFQAIIASSMGAKFIYHLDQSQEQVLWTQEYCKTNNITNIRSIQCDITKAIPIDEDSVDIVLVFGIWHHLSKPSDFMHHLLPKLNLNDSHIWLRIYRAGSWSRWLVENLRKISEKININDLEALLDIRYPYQNTNQYKGDALDDLFAPIWQAFYPKQFNIENVSSFINYSEWEYDFNNNDENFRVDFNVNYNNINNIKKFSFPNKGINQTNLVFNKNYKLANNIQNLFNEWENSEDSTNLNDKLITLYELVRRKPAFSAYTQTYLKDNNSIDFNKRLELLHFLLLSFKKEQNCI